METVQLSTETERTSAVITTTMQTSTNTTNPSTVAKESPTLDYTTASDNPSTGTVMHTNAMPDSIFQALTVSASQMTCLNKCTSHCSSFVNGTAGAVLNIPYKVDLRSLSSYRRSHQSAPDSRMSSFYIGCVGSVILVMIILFIMMLDFLPNA